MMNDYYFMRKALKQAKKALFSGDFPVGCVLAYEEKILVTGFRKNTSIDPVSEIDHAELIALKKLAKLTESIDPKKITLYSTLEPCLMCFGALILSGIDKIVYAFEDVMGGGTQCDLTRMAPLYKNRQISIKSGILRNESLELFKTYFSDPKTIYWKESPLADYTLNQ